MSAKREKVPRSTERHSLCRHVFENYMWGEGFKSHGYAWAQLIQPLSISSRDGHHPRPATLVRTRKVWKYYSGTAEAPFKLPALSRRHLPTTVHFPPCLLARSSYALMDSILIRHAQLSFELKLLNPDLCYTSSIHGILQQVDRQQRP